MILVLFGEAFLSLAVAAPAEEGSVLKNALSLRVGESRVVPGAGGGVQLTRRGTVDAFTTDDGRTWTVTGLRKGFVILSVKDEQGEVRERYRIEVRRAERQRRGRPLPPWICDQGGVRCDEGGTVRGTTTDSEWYARAKKVCEASRTCHFAVTLGGGLRLKAHVFAVEGSAATELGLETTSFGPSLTLSPEAGMKPTSWTSTLKHLRRSKKARLVAEPLIRLVPGKPARVESGGEFPSITQGREGRETVEWLRYGLELEVTAWPSGSDLVYFDYELALTTRPRPDGARLANGFRGGVILPRGKARLIGTVETSSEGSREDDSPLLAGVPIVGPLFKNRRADEAKARIYFWLEVLGEDDAVLSEGFSDKNLETQSPTFSVPGDK